MSNETPIADRWSLVTYRLLAAQAPIEAFEAIATVLEEGNRKHGKGTWATRYADDLDEPSQKAARHLMMAEAHEHDGICWLAIDQDSGTHHIVRAIVDLAIGYALALREAGNES